jgi:hypothetical protein
MPTWARYLRKVHVTWCPYTANATPSAFLATVTTTGVRNKVPALQVSHELLQGPKGADSQEAPPSRTTVTYADGSEDVFDLSTMQVRDIIEMIDNSNGRIAAEEIKRGRPF